MIPRLLERRIGSVALTWTVLFGLASLTRIASSPCPIDGPVDLLELVLPYWAIALAPIAAHRIAAHSFPSGTRVASPDFHLSFYGRWYHLSPHDAARDPAFGPAGFMASLLIGLLLNVALRSGEFVLSMPALNGHAPSWGEALFRLMAADVATMSFFYTVCFVMALRGVPHFPRMLLFAWLLDIFTQLAIAHHLEATAQLPLSVVQPLQHLLQGNIQKVMISAFVWLPYLILSDRVNVTYRRRIRRA